MIRIADEKLYFTPYEGVEYEVGNIADGIVADEYFSLGDLSLPIERFPELHNTFVLIYPDGKPEPIPVTPEISVTTEERLSLLEEAMNAIIGGM